MLGIETHLQPFTPREEARGSYTPTPAMEHGQRQPASHGNLSLTQ